MIPVIGIGAGGHARVVIDILRCVGDYEIKGVVDRNPALKGTELEGIRVLGTDEMLAELFSRGVKHAFIGVGGVGDNSIRAAIYARLREAGFTVVKCVHPRAVVARSAEIGEGSVVMAGTVINPGVKIGADVILNTGAIIDHDCIIGDHAHIAPGVVLSGNVVVGSYSHVGTAACIRQGIRIGSNTVIGAGAVVVQDLPDNVTAVGVPAKVTAERAISASK